MTTPNPRTLTGRRELARRARRFGYFRGTEPSHPGGIERVVRVRCPLCRDWVTRREPNPHSMTITKALDAAVVAHLEDYCRAVHGDDWEDVVSA